MTLNGFPYGEIVFGSDGLPADPSVRGAPAPLSADAAVTDLLFLAHGWNEDPGQARALYGALTAAMVRAGGAPPGLGVVGLIWPAKVFDDVAQTAAAQTAAIAADPASRARFTQAVRAAIPQAAPAPSWADPGDQQDMFFGLDPAAVFDALGRGVDPIPDGVANVLNLATYYTMKARAGLVGGAGLAPVLAATRRAQPYLRLHLAGHSFGARVAAAALAAGGALPVASATLLQAAFSHYGFAKQWDGVHDGLFRPALLGGRVTGPLVATYSTHDVELGIAYALASRMAGQADSALGPIGGVHDVYGALGANGALSTPEAVWQPMLPVGGAYVLSAGAVNNLDSSSYIPNHIAVTSDEVGQLLVAAVTTNEIGATEG